VVLLMLWLGGALPAAAQQPEIVPAPPEPTFFSRSDFHLNAAWIRTVPAQSPVSDTGADRRFMWDTFWGGSVDIFDYVGGRLGVIIDYEAVLGGEYQAFDPNQGNYTLEASASARFGAQTEVVGMLHHVSRHLSDRPKVRNPVAFNELGVRVLRHDDVGRVRLDVAAEGGRTIEHAYVDYTWLADVNVLARMRLSNRVGLFAHGAGHLAKVDGTVPDRTRQSGGLVDVGVRINGTGGAMELFAGIEKRFDADPLDRQPQHWVLAGFRLLSR
jgi:hypothetical protein